MATKTRIEQRLEKRRELIAQRLRDALKTKGLTQRQFATLAGMTVSYVNRVLQAESDLTMRTIANLEEVLGFDLIFIPVTIEEPIPQPFIKSSGSGKTNKK